MGEGTSGGMHRRTFAAWIAVVGVVAVAQSILHLEMVFEEGRMGAFVDLDRSNGLPDLVSTGVLAVATLGAAALVRRESGTRRLVPGLATACLAALTIADLLHDGAHPSRPVGRFVIALAAGTVCLLGLIRVGTRGRLTLASAVCLLGGAFCIDGLDRLTQRFEPERRDLTTESQIVAKEGLELLGWSLVALALWDEALRRPTRHAGLTAPASRARAASRRRAA